MKATFLLTAVQNGAKRIPMGLVVAAGIFLHHNAATAAAIPTVNLGTADSFAVLAGAGITAAGAVNTTIITGDIGSFDSTPAITGLENIVLTGASQNHAGDGVTQNAKNALVTAYLDAAGRIDPVATYPGGFDLVGLTLTSGVYKDASDLFLSGTLTLDAAGNRNAVWIFQAGSTLITASSSKVVFLNGVGDECNVFWQVGSSATLGTNSNFVGNILALTDIHLLTGAKLDGSALARNGAVTLDRNTITNEDCRVRGGVTGVPDTGSTLVLLSSALATLFVFRRQFPRVIACQRCP